MGKIENKWQDEGLQLSQIKNRIRDFPGGAVVKNLPASGGDTGSSPSLGRIHMPQNNEAHVSQP